MGNGLFGSNWLPDLFDKNVEENNRVGMLAALNNTTPRNNIFQGADAAKRATNRRRNKAARKARRAGRR